MNKSMTFKKKETKKVLLSGILILGIIFWTTGCSDDLLTTVPPDEVSSVVFWSSERDFNTALNGTYERMMGVNLDPMYFDGATDIGYSHADWMRQHEYVMGRADALSGWSAGMWSRIFTGISRSNVILEQLEYVEDGVLSAGAADHIRGQALFLRGYFYHQLLWMFGDVAIFTNVPTIEEAREISRSPRDQVYDRIITDLSQAASLLPEGWTDNQYGRATRGTALGYHARTALYEASWQKYHEQNQARATELFRTAADIAQEVMDLNVYSLHPDFRELFTYAGEQSSEILFDFQRVSGQNGWHAWLGFAPSSMGSNVDVSPTRQLVDRFPRLTVCLLMSHRITTLSHRASRTTVTKIRQLKHSVCMLTAIRSGAIRSGCRPLSATASRVHATANCAARSIRRICCAVRPTDRGSKSASAAICDRYGAGS
jgi:starch-binding outer membrane protein, SusD/RagB family